MQNPISKIEAIRRMEEEISRRIDALETVQDRIARANLSITSAPARAIMRKVARMQERVNLLQTELETFRKD